MTKQEQPAVSSRAAVSPLQCERLWSLRDVSQFLGVPVGTLYQWRVRGEGPPAFKVGRHVRFDPDRVRAALFEEGLALRNGEEMLAGYVRLTRGTCLMTLGLTHPFQHMGTIGALSRLLGIEYE